jgi:putative phage-type endonuclease
MTIPTTIESYIIAAIEAVKTARLAIHVQELLKWPQYTQLSPEWYSVRKEMMTASSDVACVAGISYNHKTNTSPEAHAHLLDNLILKKTGRNLDPFKGSAVTRWGQMFEEVIARIYMHKTGSQVLEFGLMRHPDVPFIGASPDGIRTDGIMIEIKCPQTRTIKPVPPKYYWAQMQTQLEICNLEQCDFVEVKFNQIKSLEEIVGMVGYEYTGAIGISYKCKCTGAGSVICKCRDDPDNRKYTYADPVLPVTAQDMEVRSQAAVLGENYHLLEVTYYAMTQYQCTRVDRDRAWWAQVLPKLRSVWERILYYRRPENVAELDELVEKTKRNGGAGKYAPSKKRKIDYDALFD